MFTGEEGLDAPLEAYMQIAYNFYIEDNLEGAMQVVLDAFERKGWAAGAWDEFYNRLTCESDARAASIQHKADDRLTIELPRNTSQAQIGQISRLALEARNKVAGILEVQFDRPAMITVFLPNAPIEFISGSHGYVEHKVDLDKICVPYEALESDEDTMDTLVHEFTHCAVFELAGNNIVHWMNEGIATYLCGDLESRQARFVVRASARNEEHLSTTYLQTTLTDMNLRKDDPLKVQSAYFLAASFVAVWVERVGMKKLREALVRMGKGQNPDKAFWWTTAMTIKEMEACWREQFRRGGD